VGCPDRGGHERSRRTVTNELGHLVPYSSSMMKMRLSCTVMEIRGLRDIVVTTLTFKTDVTSSVTRPLDPSIPRTKPEVDSMLGC